MSSQRSLDLAPGGFLTTPVPFLCIFKNQQSQPCVMLAGASTYVSPAAACLILWFLPRNSSPALVLAKLSFACVVHAVQCKHFHAGMWGVCAHTCACLQMPLTSSTLFCCTLLFLQTHCFRDLLALPFPEICRRPSSPFLHHRPLCAPPLALSLPSLYEH